MDRSDAVAKKAGLVRRLRAPRGQAMVEYSVIAHFILIGGGLLLMPAASMLFNKLSEFYDSVYTIIETAAV
jgi:Flp pilus assembly pilin Flp